MKNLLYPLVATALITITPFLVSFEKGQDIVRGLFCYSIFFLLLMFANVKDCTKSKRRVMVPLVVVALLIVAFLDLKSLVLYKNGVYGWYAVIPFITVAFAVAMVSQVKGFALNTISFIMFASLGLHSVMMNVRADQPVFEFPVVKAISRMAAYNPPRYVLPDSFVSRYNVSDSASVTKLFIDTSRTNVVVLVESWGVPMDTNLFNQELALFGSMKNASGVHYRTFSRTRTAEREDLLDSAWQDSTRHRDSLFIPNKLKELGFQNTFLFGGDSTIQWRYRYVNRIGFENALFTDSLVCDSLMAVKLDSFLQDSSKKQLIAWTTRDTRFPISEDADETAQLYYERLFKTLNIVAGLAKEHPEVRFIVQGDHEPIVAPIEFAKKFYRRWVPYVVLN